MLYVLDSLHNLIREKYFGNIGCTYLKGVKVALDMIFLAAQLLSRSENITVA